MLLLFLILLYIEAHSIFEWNNHTNCHVHIEDSKLKVNLSTLENKESRNIFEKRIFECSPQACIPSNNELVIVCQYPPTGELVFVTKDKTIRTNQHAIFASYDNAHGNQIAVYDGSTIKKHLFFPDRIEETFKDDGYQTIPFFEDISDFEIKANRILVIMDGSVFEIDSEGNHNFVMSANSSRLGRSLPSVTITPTNFEIGPLAAVLIPVIEIVILIIFLMFCKWKIYRTPSGRLFFEPTQSIVQKYPYYNLRPRDRGDSIKEPLNDVDTPYRPS